MAVSPRQRPCLHAYRRNRLRFEPLEDRRMLSVLFVDDNAASGGDGLAWASAFDDLQAALDSASVLNADADTGNDVDQIWIAEGVYRPSAELGPGEARSASFSLLDGVTLYGGFEGVEAALEERDWSAHETVLSGDLGVVDDKADNAHTVVYCGEDITSALDGVSVIGGHADSIYNSAHQEASYGGGIFNSGTLQITNAAIYGNSANGYYGSGGGVYSAGALTIANSTLSGNSASDDGGGIYSSGALTVTNSTLSGNSADRSGGIYTDYNSGTLTLNNSILYGNDGGELDGGGPTSALNNLIGIDPQFVRAPSDGGDGWGDNPDTSEVDESANDDFGDLRLTAASPAINYGDADSAVDAGGDPLVTDFGGNPRVFGATADAGAYEFQGGQDAGREEASLRVTTTKDVFDLYDGQVSLREAIYYAGTNSLGTTIMFDSALDEATITLAGTALWIDKGLTIDASSLTSLTIDADRKSRVFNVAARDAEDVELINLTVTGGSTEDGGGIYSSGTLTVTRCTLIGNSADRSGGGIYNQHGTLTVGDSSFSSNSAETFGGGIHNDSGTLTVTGSTFSGNSSSFGGGGISNAGTLTVTSCTLWGNSADSYGGAIYSGYNTLSVTDSTFADNSANADGGGICSFGALTVAGCTLWNNLATRGGGIYTASDSDTLTVTNSTLSGNSADQGGGIYANSRSIALPVTNCTLSGNSADSYGGGVYNTGMLTLTGCRLDSNSANRGGGIYNDDSGVLTVTGNTFSTNSAHSGGGIYDDGTTAVTNSTFRGNSADANGGALYGSGSATLTNCTLSDNSADYGGGIFNAYTLNLNNSIVAQNTAASGPDVYQSYGTLTGSHNLIGNGSGQSELVDGVDGNLVGSSETPIDPLLLADGRLQVGSPAIDAGDNVMFPSEITTDLAGAERIQDGDSDGIATVDIGAYEGVTPGPYLSISDSSLVEGDSSTVDMVFTVTLSEATDHDVAFDYTTRDGTAQAWADYTALNGRGTIPAGTATATIVIPICGDTLPEYDETFSVILSSSTALLRRSGVGSVLDDDPLVVTMLDDVVDSTDGMLSLREALATFGSTITFDPALYVDGPATIALAGSELVVDRDVSIEGPGEELLSIDAGNTSRVFSFGDNVTASINGLTIAGGSTSGSGGGIYNRGALTVTDCMLAGNSAEQYGGGVYNRGTLTVIDCSLSGNSAGSQGGGIYNTGTLTVTNGDFSENSAIYSGGICNDDGMVMVTDCTFSGNAGRAVCTDRGTLTITNCTLSGNTGRGISNYGGTMTVTNCTLLSNGGGIYNTDGTATVTACTISDNSADYGGGVHNTGTATVVNCTLAGNSADQGGGGIYNRGTLTVTNSTLARNSAGTGGGIYNELTLTLDNSIVAANTALSGPDVYQRDSLGTITGSHTLIGDGTGQTALVHGADGNLVGTSENPLDPLFVREPSDGGDGWGDDPSTPHIDESANNDYGDLRLRAGSRAIDAGDNALIPSETTTDVVGAERIQDGNDDGTATVDMGAYESAVPGPYLSISDSSIVEGDSGAADMVFTVTLSDVADHDITFDYTTRDGSAHAGNDYTTTAGSGTIPAGDTTATFTVPILGEVEAELDETFYVVMSSPAGFLRSPGVGLIFDTDPLVVTTLADVVDSTDGLLSLREALAEVGPTVIFDPALYAEGPATIALAGSELLIDRDVSIEGPGAGLLSVDAAGGCRVFSIHEEVTANISGLTISGGSAFMYGGGISNRGTLTVRNSTLSGNSSSYYGGGIYSTGTLTLAGCELSDNVGAGIYSDDGLLTVTDTIFSGNSGNGIHIDDGTLTVTNSIFSGNVGRGIYGYHSTLTVTDTTLSGNMGGGIYASGGTLTVANCTFAGNSDPYGAGIHGTGATTVTNSSFSYNTATRGGGIYNTGTLTVTNCLFSDNSADKGGGIHGSDDATLTITNCTLTSNSADDKGGGVYGRGTITLNNSIVANNTAPSGPDVYRYAGTLTGAHNLIGNGTGQTAFVHGIDGNLVGTFEIPLDPLFVREPSDGGDGWGDNPDTPGVDESANDDFGDLRLRAGSTAVDAGDNALLPSGITTDVAGAQRIQDGDDDGTATVNMGAYETVAMGPYLSISDSSIVEGDSDAVDMVFTVMLSDIADYDVRFDYTTWDGTSHAGTDYAATSGSGTIPAGETTATIRVPILADEVAENDETFFVRVSSTADITRIYGVGSILNEDPIVVTTLTDVTDATDGLLSLREALAELNSMITQACPVITFAPALYTEGPSTIVLAGRALVIDKDVFVEGPGDELLSVDGGNASRVFSIGEDTTVTLSGLTITGGSTNTDGAGIYNAGTLTVMNSTVSGNLAEDDGGGVYSTGTLTVTDSVLSDNSAGQYGGGVLSTGTVTVTSGIFSRNGADRGGGIYNDEGTLTITSSTLSSNTADRGGGICNYQGTLTVSSTTVSGNAGGGIYGLSGTLTVTDSTVSGNTGRGISNNDGSLTVTNCLLSNNVGGGIYNEKVYFGGTAIVTDCALSGNSASYGAGIYSLFGTLSVINSTIWGNSASDDGGGIYGYYGGSLSVTNSAISQNSAGGNGGGICSKSETAELTNCTIIGNSAQDHGGGVYNADWLRLNNTIVAENTASSGPDVYHSGDFLSGYSCLIGDGSGQSALVDGSRGNLVGSADAPIDPLLLADGRLRLGSPAVDAGDNWLIPDEITIDLAGAERIQDGDGDGTATVDMGAYEGIVPGPYLSISDVSSVEGDSETADMVFTVTLSDIADYDVAFDYATEDGTAQAGTDYTATSGSGTIPAGETTATIIVPILGDEIAELDETFFVRLLSSTNLTRLGGLGSILDEDPITVTTSADVVDLTDGLVSLREALAEGYAIITFDPAIYAEGPATIVLADSKLAVARDVSIKGPGSGLLSIEAPNTDRVFLISKDVTASLSGLTITGGSTGGGIYNAGTLSVIDCMLSANSAAYGGGIYNYSGTMTVTNCAFLANSAANYGGGIYSTGTMTVTNCTFSANSAGQDGGGIYNYGVLTLDNSIVAGNTASYAPDLRKFGPDSSLTGSHNLIGDGTGQTALSDGTDGNLIGNADAPIDPLLLADGRLRLGSPAVDAGANGLVPSEITTDLDGAERIQDGDNDGTEIVDIGAYEGTVPGPYLTISDSSVVEGDSGATDMLFTLTLSDAVDYDVTFGYATEDRTAEAGSDYTATGGSGKIPAGQTAATITVPIRGDDSAEFDETFFVRLSSTTDLTRLGGIGSIRNEDPIVVTTLADTVDSTDGLMSLREALAEGYTIIAFDSTLCAEGPATIALTGSQLLVDDDVSIEGPGAELLSIDAGGDSRVFSVAEDTTVSISGLTLTGGSTSNDGAGVYNRGVLTVTNCRLSDNSADDRGGAIYNNEGTLTVSNSMLAGNSADDHGGAIYNYFGTTTVAQSTLSDNLGGGIYNSGTLAVTNSTLSGNSATQGGGIYNYSGTLTLTNSTLQDNSAGVDGGGIYIYNGTLAATNSTLWGNSAGNDGGAICRSSGKLTVTNCTLFGNSAIGDGGGIYSRFGSLILNNSIVAQNTASSGADVYHSSGTLTGSHNLIGDGTGQTALVDGSDGNMVGNAETPIDPLLLTDGRLQEGSPAVDAGDNGLVPLEITTDLTGAERIQDGDGDGTATVDMGAYEGAAPGPYLSISDSSLAEGDSGTANMLFTVTLSEAADHDVAFDYVTQDGTAEAGSDYTATNGCGTIPAGETNATIAVPILGDEVAELDEIFFVGLSSTAASIRLSAVGTILNEDPIVVTTLADVVDSTDGFVSLREALIEIGETIAFDPALYAEGAATIALNGSRLVVARNVSIEGPGAELLSIDAGGSSRVFSVESNVTATISGLTITGGSASNGGGIYSRGSLTVTNCTLSGNTASGSGGGIYSYDGTLAVASSMLFGNSASGGGGIYILHGSLTATNSTISSNSSNGSGGGIYSSYGELTMTNSMVSSNSATRNGGGIYSSSGTLTLVNSSLSSNSADDIGGGIYSFDGELTVANGTLSGNSACRYGGGIYGSSSDTITLNNSIIAKNIAPSGPDIYHPGATLTGSHNLIGNGTGQSALINGQDGNLVGTAETPINPLFIRNPSDGGDGWGDNLSTPDIDESANDDYGDLRLQADSRAIDAGDNTLLPADEFDLDGDGDTTEPIPVDLAGVARIQDGDNDQTVTVDMGAYEYVATSPVVPGDLNGDGMVGGADLDIVRAHWGQSVAAGDFTMGDPSGDGAVGGDDLDIVRANWGQAAPAASVIPAASDEGPITAGSAPVYGPRRQHDSNRQTPSDALFANTRLVAEAAWADAVEALGGRRARKDHVTAAVDLALSEWE